MILLSRRKKRALLLFFVLFGGSISGLGSLSNVALESNELEGKKHQEGYWESFQNSPVSFYQVKGKSGIGTLKEIFRDSKALRIFDKVHYLSVDGEDSEGNTLTIVQKIKKKILEKILEMVKDRNVIGQFMYRWAEEKILLVIVRFRLIKGINTNWYYDWFSVKIN